MTQSTPQQEDWRYRVTEKYLKEYVADEQEAREVMEILKTGPVWFEWWMDVLSTERTKAKQEERSRVVEIVEKLKLTDDSVYNYYDVEKDHEVAKKMTGAYNAGLAELLQALKKA